jgi:hypothetical protein
MKKTALLSILSLVLAVPADSGDVRWHFNDDGSILLDDDEHGQRLVLPEEREAGEQLAIQHYAEVNPDSATKLSKGLSVSFDIYPQHILSVDELASWSRESTSSWWEFDLVVVLYRRYEDRAIAEARADPDRAQEELTQKRVTKAIREPSRVLISRLAAHNVHYTGKAASYSGDRNWTFQVNDPDGSARSFGVLTPEGSSEKTIMQKVYEVCLSDSNVYENGKRVLTQQSRTMLSWVRW